MVAESADETGGVVVAGGISSLAAKRSIRARNELKELGIVELMLSKEVSSISEPKMLPWRSGSTVMPRLAKYTSLPGMLLLNMLLPGMLLPVTLL